MVYDPDSVQYRDGRVGTKNDYGQIVSHGRGLVSIALHGGVHSHSGDGLVVSIRCYDGGACASHHGGSKVRYESKQCGSVRLFVVARS